MISLAQLALIMTLVPLVAGILLAALGARLPRRAALPIALVAALVAFVAALFLAGAAVVGIPQLIRVIAFGDQLGLVHRLDSFAAYAIIGVTAWVAPVLIWMTTPRGPARVAGQHTTRPLGWAMCVEALLLSALMLDNIPLIVLCWAGIGLLAWLIARPETAFVPTSSQEWIDLLLLVLGPVLFGLTMLFPMVGGKSVSMFDLTGRNLINFGQGTLIILALAFAAGMYPFLLWVRRVTQGVLPEATGVLLLASLPMAIVMLGRISPLLAPNGTWPVWHISQATFPLNAELLVLGIITILVSGFVLLFETDLVVITALLSLLVLGWCFTAFGTGDNRALLGVTLLLLTYVLGIGALLAVWASLEWADRELTVDSLAGFAQTLPAHFVTLTLAGLTLVGVPLLAGFAGMATIDQGIISEGGTAALAGALMWIGNTCALLGFLRILSHAMHRSPLGTEAAPAQPHANESLALLIPAVLLIIFGVAPEIVLIGKATEPGPALAAATALLNSGLSIPDVSTSVLGFSVAHTLWVPGIFWALAVIGIGVIVLSAGLIGPDADPTPVFVGGEPLNDDPRVPLDSWQDLATIARNPFVLPGPGSWRNDIGDIEGWSEDEDDATIGEADLREDSSSDLADNDVTEYPATTNGHTGIDDELNEFAEPEPQADLPPPPPAHKFNKKKGGARG